MFRRTEKESNTFKLENSLEKRKELSAKILQVHSDRLPVIVLKVKGASRNTPNISKTKFLVPPTMNAQQLLHKIRESFHKLGAEQAIYLFVGNGVLVPSSSTLEQIYHRFKDVDGFLYIYYSAEDTFG